MESGDGTPGSDAYLLFVRIVSARPGRRRASDAEKQLIGSWDRRGSRRFGRGWPPSPGRSFVSWNHSLSWHFSRPFLQCLNKRKIFMKLPPPHPHDVIEAAACDFL